MGNSDSKALKPTVKLMPKEKKLLATSWSSHVDRDQFIGGRVFDQMFTEAPDLKKGFAHFAEIDVHDQHYNDVLHRHGVRVKSAVARSIEAINDKAGMQHYLTKLGCRHYKEYNFEPKYITVIFDYFLKAIKELMGDDWTEEVETAYSKLFEIIAFHMINSLATNKPEPHIITTRIDDGTD